MSTNRTVCRSFRYTKETKAKPGFYGRWCADAQLCVGASRGAHICRLWSYTHVIEGRWCAHMLCLSTGKVSAQGYCGCSGYPHWVAFSTLLAASEPGVNVRMT